MEINNHVFPFASRSLKACLGSDTSNRRGARGGGPSRAPFYLLDLYTIRTDTLEADTRGYRTVKGVYREQIPNPNTAEWATLSYTRGQVAPRRGSVETVQLAIDNRIVLTDILDDTGTRTLVPAGVLYGAIRVVLDLGIQYLWVDVLCSFWGPDDDGDGWVKSYMNIFEGAKVNIALPDYYCIKDKEKESRIGEPEEDSERMEEVYNAYLGARTLRGRKSSMLVFSFIRSSRILALSWTVSSRRGNSSVWGMVMPSGLVHTTVPIVDITASMPMRVNASSTRRYLVLLSYRLKPHHHCHRRYHLQDKRKTRKPTLCSARRREPGGIP
ncbi:hypothetical protein PG993_010173 [Apiospora rasikravindrae]|uniref:Heterokaryon incompatibility domain-containing protein n=1 Tax=Apiospora rasikravindrae TaxID=990691 RepID=A0ABR1SNT6_9PEZI